MSGRSHSYRLIMKDSCDAKPVIECLGHVCGFFFGSSCGSTHAHWTLAGAVTREDQSVVGFGAVERSSKRGPNLVNGSAPLINATLERAIDFYAYFLALICDVIA